MAYSKEKIILLFLFLVLFGINYPFLDGFVEDFLNSDERGVVTRVIDGDTIVVNNKTIRLLGINSPERGEKFYSESKEFLESEILNQTVSLKIGVEGIDRYGRTLAYIFYNERNINLESVRFGFSNFYFPSGKDIYYKEFLNAWNFCLDEEINLCRFSNLICSKCIILNEFDVDNEIVIFENICDFDCNIDKWIVKDQGRKKFVFEDKVIYSKDILELIVGNGVDNTNTLFWKDEDYVWTNSGDTLFLRDNKGLLVLWENY